MRLSVRFSLWQAAVLVFSQVGATRKTPADVAELGAILGGVDGARFAKLANEFELLAPGNIVKLLGVGGSVAEISKVAPLVISNNDVVNVEVVSKKPVSSDWIGAYSPADVDISTTVPVKYAFLDSNKSYLSTGKASLQFNMTNLRADIKFYMFSGSLSKPVLVTSSDSLVSFANNDEPVRPRVVASGDPDVLNLLWSSDSSKAPTLKWGTASGSHTRVVAASSKRISKDQMCGGTAATTGWRDMGLINTAPLAGMKALGGTRIYYVFGDDATGLYSQEYSFQVPPQAGQQPPNRPTTAILYCDMGRGSNDDTYTWNEYGRPAINTSESVGARVEAGLVDVIFHGGDVSYAVGYEAVWDFFLNMISPVASGALYLTTMGNHESDYPGSPSYYQGPDSGGECGVTTTNLLPLPAPATTNTPWYSYDVGLLHLVGMSSEHDFTIGSAQLKWLEQDLQAVDREKTPWVVLNLHRAMYINSNFGGDETSDLAVSELMVTNIEPLLKKYRVNLGFYGHNHVVQRQAAVYQFKVVQKSTAENIDGEVVHMHRNPQATVHMVVGTAGASFTKNAETPRPLWNELFFYEYGYAVLTAVNASYLDWQWVSSNTNQVLDRVAIVQDDPNKAWV